MHLGQKEARQTSPVCLVTSQVTAFVGISAGGSMKNSTEVVIVYAIIRSMVAVAESRLVLRQKFSFNIRKVSNVYENE